MAIRTYIPAILTVAKYIKKFVTSNSERLKQYGGDGFYAVLVLVMDLFIIITNLIDGGHTPGDSWSDFNAVNSLTATTINEIEAAIAKFWASIGVTP